MKALWIVSEAEPFAKTGGLADVAAALPNALRRLGHDVRIALPLYRETRQRVPALRPTMVTVSVWLGDRAMEARVWDGTAPGGTPVYCIECNPLFDRDGLYQAAGRDHPDNLRRFSVFSQAALRMVPSLRWQPDLVHCHDWQTALACAHLALGPIGRAPGFAACARVFTVHNLAYQGLFPRAEWPLTGLPEAAFSLEGLEFHGKINCLKGGLVTAERLTTVSPTYAREIQTEASGCGLDGVLRARRQAIVGILNGIDTEVWNPQTDPALAARYSVEQRAGKALCKLALQRRLGLPESHGLLIGMIQRLAEQKGIDLFLEAAEELLSLPVQVALLGTGDPGYHRQLEQLAARRPDRFAAVLAFDEVLAHQIEAGADAFLMPSRFEPCGLNQLYSMRYGTVPIVRRVGGLADSVVDLTPAAKTARAATGFVFDEGSPRALLEAVRRAVAAFRDHDVWAAVMEAGMRQDVSWDRPARAYAELYAQASRQRARFLGGAFASRRR